MLLKYSKGLICDSLSYARTIIARTIREAGLDIDIRGSVLVNDIAYLEPLNRHRNILSLYGRNPEVSASAYIAPNATVVGNVFIGSNSYLGFGSIAKGDKHPIRIGSNTKIGENTVLQTNLLGNDEAYPVSTNIGNNVNIEQGCNLMSCIVDDDVHVGFKSVIMEGSQIERGAVIEPNSYIPAGSRIPAYTVWAGVPATFVRNIDSKEANKVQNQTGEQIRIGQL